MARDREDKLRLFVGIDVPPNVAREIAAVQARVRERSLLRGRYTDPANLHLTLKFLGETPTAEVDGIRERLRRVQFDSFRATLDELGTFSSRGRIRILWLHLAAPELVQLQAAVDDALSDLFEVERRFMSHLTIARAKSVPNPRRLLAEIKTIAPPPLAFAVDKFKLKCSTLRAAGPVYADLETFAGR